MLNNAECGSFNKRSASNMKKCSNNSDLLDIRVAVLLVLVVEEEPQSLLFVNIQHAKSMG